LDERLQLGQDLPSAANDVVKSRAGGGWGGAGVPYPKSGEAVGYGLRQRGQRAIVKNF
jgi:hypothetical protein